MKEIMKNKWDDKIETFSPGFYGLDDAAQQSFYLIEGEDAALLIDTGMQQRPLLPVIRTLTDKPVVLALTHAHPDHMYHADEFQQVYIGAADQKVWRPWLCRLMYLFCQMKHLPVKRFDVSRYLQVTQGAVIDLGGNQITVLEAPGHTPGSVLYVDHQHKAIFAGDAFGSGMMVLLALPASSCISAYEKNLELLLPKLKGLEDYTIYCGHRNQRYGAGERGLNYENPVTVELIRDMKTLCGRLLHGTVKPQGCGLLSAAYGKAEIVFRRDQLR